MMDIWPSQAQDEAAMERSRAILQGAIYPSDQTLPSLYVHWLRKYRWTAEEAASLVMRANPRVVLDALSRDVLPLEDKKNFDYLVDIIVRKFGADVSPRELRDYLPTIQVESELLWSAIDYFWPSEKEHSSKSGQTKESKTRNKILFGLALANGYRSNDHRAVSKIMSKLERVGISIDDDTLRNHLKKLAGNPDFKAIEAALHADPLT